MKKSQRNARHVKRARKAFALAHQMSDAGISRTKVAKALDLSVPTISNYMKFSNYEDFQTSNALRYQESKTEKPNVVSEDQIIDFTLDDKEQTTIKVIEKTITLLSTLKTYISTK